MSGAAGPISPNLGSKFGESAGWCASIRVSQRGLIMRYNGMCITPSALGDISKTLLHLFLSVFHACCLICKLRELCFRSLYILGHMCYLQRGSQCIDTKPPPEHVSDHQAWFSQGVEVQLADSLVVPMIQALFFPGLSLTLCMDGSSRAGTLHVIWGSVLTRAGLGLWPSSYLAVGVLNC